MGKILDPNFQTLVDSYKIQKNEEIHQEMIKKSIKGFATDLFEHAQDRFEENDFIKAVRILDIWPRIPWI